MNARTILGLVFCLILTSCDDSKNPLSDPTTSKPDNRLIGVWRLPDWDEAAYYYVGQAGDKFPNSTMGMVFVRHEEGKVASSGEFFVFPTVLGEKTYLNVTAGTEQQIRHLEEKGWKAVDLCSILKYQVDGDKLLVWCMVEDAKKRAIEGGKVKGVIEENNSAKFTDTTENVARFVADAGDGLFYKRPLRLERVNNSPRKIEGSQIVPTPPLRPMGSDLMVDKKGIIWDRGKPVGLWGIDGGKTKSR